MYTTNTHHKGCTWVKIDTIDTRNKAVLRKQASDTVIFLTSDTILLLFSKLPTRFLGYISMYKDMS